MAMEIFVSIRGGYKVECSGCLVKIKLGDAKKINHKFYCPICYPLVKRKDCELNDSNETIEK